jgi:hypothetical protein
MTSPWLIILVLMVLVEVIAFWVFYVAVKSFLEIRKSLSKSLRGLL